jgi:anti-sigma factor RsiW
VRHPSEDDIENYSLDLLQEPALGEIEEHLLTCEECRGRVSASDAYVRAMRQAARRLRQAVSGHTSALAVGSLENS